MNAELQKLSSDRQSNNNEVVYGAGSNGSSAIPIQNMGAQQVQNAGQNQCMINYGGMQLVPSNDPLNELLSYTMVSINQKFEFVELLTGCDIPNEYIVIGETWGYQSILFNIVEDASCCCLTCTPSYNKTRHLTMNIVKPVVGSAVNRQVSTAYYQQYKCCMGPCCSRPELLKLVGGVREDLAQNKLKAVSNPYNLCDYNLEVFADDGNLKYKINGKCCQCGICCRHTCGRCSEVNFEIINNSGAVAGKITKKFNCAKSVTHEDFYHLYFPMDADIDDRIKLIFATVFLDYMYYERSGERSSSKKQ